MIANAIVDFLSRDCRNAVHQKCLWMWYGLGLKARCTCSCHNQKEVELGRFGEPASNPNVEQSLQEGTRNDNI